MFTERSDDETSPKANSQITQTTATQFLQLAKATLTNRICQVKKIIYEFQIFFIRVKSFKMLDKTIIQFLKK